MQPHICLSCTVGLGRSLTISASHSKSVREASKVDTLKVPYQRVFGGALDSFGCLTF